MKNEIQWFNLKNYENLRDLSIKEWENELFQRVHIHFFAFNDGTIYDKQKIRKQELNSLPQKIEVIKKFGLFSNIEKYNQNQRPKYYSLRKSPIWSAVSDITIFDAYDYFDHEKDDLTVKQDIETLNQNMYSDEKNKSMELLYEKYQSPFSNHRHKDNDCGERFLKLNLNNTDEIIKEEFNKWLQNARTSFGFAQKNISNNRLKAWSDQKLLECWDIITICKIEKIKVTNKMLGQLLFKDDGTHSEDEENIRKTTRPNAIELVSYENLEILNAMMRIDEV